MRADTCARVIIIACSYCTRAYIQEVYYTRRAAAQWLPFLRNECQADETTIVVGHSSGAEAAMRLAEGTQLAGIVLVSACWTDLGEPSEAAAGYYNRPWQWESIKANCGFITQFHSDTDPFIPLSESDHVAANLDSDYRVLEGRSHFFNYPFPELLEEVVGRAAGAAGAADADADAAAAAAAAAVAATPEEVDFTGSWSRNAGLGVNNLAYLRAHGSSREEAIAQAKAPYVQKWTRDDDGAPLEWTVVTYESDGTTPRRELVYHMGEWSESHDGNQGREKGEGKNGLMHPNLLSEQAGQLTRTTVGQASVAGADTDTSFECLSPQPANQRPTARAHHHPPRVTAHDPPPATRHPGLPSGGGQRHWVAGMGPQDAHQGQARP